MRPQAKHCSTSMRSTPDCESLRADLKRALDALNLVEAADRCLRSGDDAALVLLGFAPAHIMELRGSVRGAQAGYPPYALKNLKATVRFLRQELAEKVLDA